MAKKRIKRKSVKKVVASVDSNSRKLWFSFWNLITFTIISLVSLGLAAFIDPEKSKIAFASFALIGLLAGFVAIAFLIVWLIFLIMKVIRK